MSTTQDNDKEQNTVVGVLLTLIILFAIALASGFGLYKSGVFGGKNGAVATSSASASAAAMAADAASASASASASATDGAAAAAATLAAPAADTASATAAADEASVQYDNGKVRFYFASGKTELAAGANDALNQLLAAAKDGQKLVISGYHDSTGSAQLNAELAKQRAIAVADALKALGVPESRLELKKPEVAEITSGSNAEARRVEVTIED
ncbi:MULTISPECIES: OmpA family protein [Brachymonas]|uniref:OmpA family protein n=1 Tax=Brachymonas TaxID=28219 RepID=UPI002E790902|nr:OmpA family protein [Brachymonas sp. J145]MEE1653644.1 OmpA family protein [Brachymonas sp. J145]